MSQLKTSEKVMIALACLFVSAVIGFGAGTIAREIKIRQDYILIKRTPENTLHHENKGSKEKEAIEAKHPERKPSIGPAGGPPKIEVEIKEKFEVDMRKKVVVDEEELKKQPPPAPGIPPIPPEPTPEPPPPAPK
jgi:hypothetical protein